MTDPTYHSLHEDFLDLEADLDLLDRTIDGVHFWERIRFKAHKTLLTELFESEEKETDDEGLLEYLAGSRLLFRNLLIRNPFLAPERELLFYSTGRRKRMNDGDWWDLYFDPLVEELDPSYEFLERPYNVSHRTPARTQNLRYTDLIEYTGTVAQKLGFATVSLTSEERDLLEELASEIAFRFGVSVPITGMVRRDLSLRRIRLPLFRRVVEQISPDVALLTTSYNGRETFVDACQAQGVPVVELQHGVITKYHLGYSYPEGRKNVFPDYFFSFGEFWSDEVDLPLRDENVFSVGYPYLERQAGSVEDLTDRDRIVVVSQPIVGEYLSRIAVELSRSDAVEYEVVYKLHPKEYGTWRQKYPQLDDGSITVVEDSPSLYRLYAGSKIQVGVNSTALFEGYYFGLETYILDVPGAEYMEYLVENGFASLVESADEIVAGAGSENTTPGGDPAYFFEPDPIENFTEGIEEVKRRERRGTR